MSAESSSVADLVLKLHSNIDSIQEWIRNLSDTDSHDEDISRLENERDAKMDGLRIQHENELSQRAEQWARRERDIADTREREEADIAERRRREDEERGLAIEREEQESLRARAKAEEDIKIEKENEEEILQNETEAEMERLEVEMEKKFENGKQALADLDEERKAINAEIDAAMNRPTVIPKMQFRRRAKTAGQSTSGSKEEVASNQESAYISGQRSPPKSIIAAETDLPQSSQSATINRGLEGSDEYQHQQIIVSSRPVESEEEEEIDDHSPNDQAEDQRAENNEVSKTFNQRDSPRSDGYNGHVDIPSDSSAEILAAKSPNSPKSISLDLQDDAESIKFDSTDRQYFNAGNDISSPSMYHGEEAIHAEERMLGASEDQLFYNGPEMEDISPNNEKSMHFSDSGPATAEYPFQEGKSDSESENSEVTHREIEIKKHNMETTSEDEFAKHGVLNSPTSSRHSSISPATHDRTESPITATIADHTFADEQKDEDGIKSIPEANSSDFVKLETRSTAQEYESESDTNSESTFQAEKYNSNSSSTLEPIINPINEDSEEISHEKQHSFSDRRSSGFSTEVETTETKNRPASQMGDENQEPDYTYGKNFDEMHQNSYEEGDREASPVAEVNQSHSQSHSPISDSNNQNNESTIRSRSHTTDTIPSFEVYAQSEDEDSVPTTPSDSEPGVRPENEQLFQPNWTEAQAGMETHEPMSQELKTQASPMHSEFSTNSAQYPSIVSPKHSHQDVLHNGTDRVSYEDSDNDTDNRQPELGESGDHHSMPRPLADDIDIDSTGNPASPADINDNFDSHHETPQSHFQQTSPVSASTNNSSNFAKARSLFETAPANRAPLSRPQSASFTATRIIPTIPRRSSIQNRPSPLYGAPMAKPEHDDEKGFFMPRSLDADGRPPSPVFTLPPGSERRVSGEQEVSLQRKNSLFNGLTKRISLGGIHDSITNPANLTESQPLMTDGERRY